MMKTRNEYFQFKKSLSTYKYNFKRGSSLNYFYRGIAVFRYGPGPLFSKIRRFFENFQKFNGFQCLHNEKIYAKNFTTAFSFSSPP